MSSAGVILSVVNCSQAWSQREPVVLELPLQIVILQLWMPFLSPYQQRSVKGLRESHYAVMYPVGAPCGRYFITCLHCRTRDQFNNCQETVCNV